MFDINVIRNWGLNSNGLRTEPNINTCSSALMLKIRSFFSASRLSTVQFISCSKESVFRCFCLLHLLWMRLSGLLRFRGSSNLLARIERCYDSFFCTGRRSFSRLKFTQHVTEERKALSYIRASRRKLLVGVNCSFSRNLYL